MKQGYDPADCIVQGVTIIEDDPNDMSVGLGGLPNAEGVVELDASVMYGPTHKSGAVASVRGIKNVAAVALLVLRRTDHALLVGEGAARFAKLHGFPEENLLTEAAREQWVKWKENLGKDAWLNDDERDELVGKPFQNERHAAVEGMHQMYTYGTVHCSAVTRKGDIASCTTTSGLSWKIPGRVGDSPIIGAGNYCDNAVGAAGCTGRGESAIANLSAYSMVRAMESGMTPAQAAMDAAKRAADHTKEKRLRRPDGRPNFNISFYCCRKDGCMAGRVFIRAGRSRCMTRRRGRCWRAWLCSRNDRVDRNSWFRQPVPPACSTACYAACSAVLLSRPALALTSSPCPGRVVASDSDGLGVTDGVLDHVRDH